MLLATQKTIAVRCPHCGKMGFYALSRFSFSGNEGVRFACECGTNLLSITQKGKALFCLQIECMMCETRHLFTYKASELWGKTGLAIACEQTDVEIGFVGSKEAVLENIKHMDRGIKELNEEVGYDKYFVKPEIMHEVLDLVRRMTDEGKVSCSCGSGTLEVEAFPDRIELNCPYCEAVGILFAETVRDLQWAYNMEGIYLEAYAYKYLDANRMNKKKPVKK